MLLSAVFILSLLSAASSLKQAPEKSPCFTAWVSLGTAEVFCVKYITASWGQEAPVLTLRWGPDEGTSKIPSGRGAQLLLVTPSRAPVRGAVAAGQRHQPCGGARCLHCCTPQLTALIFSALLLAGGIGFGRAKGNSGSEADDETQLTFYTEQYRSRRRSKGKNEIATHDVNGCKREKIVEHRGSTFGRCRLLPHDCG